ncbi:Thiol:disulfide interchange protein DsbD [termite gut metagenome]|uniref:Thiol:disulfide interchange protein DsbD n=1 Tax=termite gut metagenome TaxID=433724 RepID=A0A5J4RV34_9ZZZZ
MKHSGKLILTTILLFSSLSGLTAQNRSIAFEQTKEWKKVIAKAKKERKLIFVDCYTDWCGPCKALEKNIFTRDTVADFFNQNFVNARFEMEKDADGIVLRKSFDIKAYPTLLFVDPKTGLAVHRLVGAGKAEWLIAGGQTAQDPARNLNSMIERYKKGERSNEFIRAYSKALGSAYMSEEQAKVTEDYLNSLDADQLATVENWVLIRENIQDPLAKPMQNVMHNRQKFYDVAGQDVVDTHLSNSIGSAAISLASWRPGVKGDFDETRYIKLVDYLESIDFPVITALAYLKTSELIRKGDWEGVLKKMHQVENDSIFGNDGQGFRYFQLNIEGLALAKDSAIVDKAVKWIDKKIAETNSRYRKADYVQSKVRLLTSINDALAADKAKMEEERYEKEGVDETGGRIIRAIRMN